MVNNIIKFIEQRWSDLVFMAMSLISLSFLIRQRGVWIFTDAGFFYHDILQTLNIALSKLGVFSTTDGFYFGFDNASLSFSRLLISFYQVILTFVLGADLGQIAYYFIYYLLCYYFGLKLLAKLFPSADKTAISLGALFLAFNPVSLLMTSLFVTSYVYALFVVFLYALLTFLEKGRVGHLFLSLLSGLYLLSYFRLVPIIILLIVFCAWLFYDKKYFNWKRIVIVLSLFVLCASPFIVGNVLSLTSSDNIVNNYQEFFDRYEEANFNFKSSFINSFSHPGGFTPSALSFFYNNRGLPGFADNFAISDTFEFYKTIQIIFNVGLLILALAFFKSKVNLKIISLIFIIFIINTIGFFLSFELFVELNRSLTVFLYNDYGFIQFIQSFLYGFLIVSLAYGFKRSVKYRDRFGFFVSLVLLYLIFNMIPFLSNHYGFQKLKTQNIPSNYKDTLFTSEEYDFSEATIFAPYHWLNFQWSPYYLDLNFAPYSKYKSLIVPNLRLAGEDFVNFYNDIYSSFNKKNFSNLGIFNIKNIILFRDVQDSNYTIDTYLAVNLESASNRIDQSLQNRDDLSILDNNDNFIHYRMPGADQHDFLLYSPKTISTLNFNNFYSEKIPLHQKPVILDQGVLNKVNLLDNINFKLNSPFLEVKSSPVNANKYFVKAYVDKKNPFLIQLNQSFSKSWKVYFVSKQEWDSATCQGERHEFNLTENSFCRYSGNAFDVSDLKYFAKPSLKMENHFAGNIVGNSFLINPEDIPSQFQEGDDLYMVIYFDKQLYYIVSLVVSIAVFIVLGLLYFVSIIGRLKSDKPHE